MKHLNKTFWWVTVFSVAMGFLETAVVIYLRKLYYPGGFVFPMVPIPEDVAKVELWREAATMVMLAAVGILTGRNRAERFGYFLYSFAVWDIVYYVFLKLFLNWPASLLTWDILFLLPVPWVGPVVAPVIVSALMILFAVTVVYFTDRGRRVTMKAAEVWLLIAGASIVIGAFIQDYVMQHGFELWSDGRGGATLLANLRDYVPQHFNWVLFGAGVAVIAGTYLMYCRRLAKVSRI